MPRHTIVQFSDVHLTPAGTLRPSVRPRENLLAALTTLRSADIDPEIVLFTGDLTDTGDPDCYQDLRRIVEETFAETPVLFLPGNHDERQAFRRHLLDEPPSDVPINQVATVNGLRVIAIDSTIPGMGDGLLAPETIKFLVDALGSPAPDGTVVALHHPPIVSPIAQMAELRLGNPDDLVAAIEGSDVRLIVCGHNHHTSAGEIGGVPVWASAAVAYRADVATPRSFTGIPGVAFSLLHLTDDGFAAHVVDVPHDARD